LWGQTNGTEIFPCRFYFAAVAALCERRQWTWAKTTVIDRRYKRTGFYRAGKTLA